MVEKLTRIIAVLSGKGGVGKTTVVSNLGITLSELGKDVLVIDGNLSGANLGLHLGLPNFYPFSLNNVLRGEIPLSQAIYTHPSGFEITPASLTDIEVNPRRLKYLLSELIGKKDFVIIDSAPGIDREVKAAVEACDEIILVVNPEITSIASAMRVKKLIQEEGKPVLGIIINKVRKEKFELSKEDIENLLEYPVIGQVPEHKKVRESIALRNPVVLHSPNSSPAIEFKRISYFLAEEEFPEPSLWQRFLSLFK